MPILFSRLSCPIPVAINSKELSASENLQPLEDFQHFSKHCLLTQGRLIVICPGGCRGMQLKTLCWLTMPLAESGHHGQMLGWTHVAPTNDTLPVLVLLKSISHVFRQSACKQRRMPRYNLWQTKEVLLECDRLDDRRKFHRCLGFRSLRRSIVQRGNRRDRAYANLYAPYGNELHLPQNAGVRSEPPNHQ